MKILETSRLVLRTFKEADLLAMTAINQDPKVMEYFPSVLNQEQTQNLIQGIMDDHQQYGYSLYAVELKSTREMIGFVGLIHRAKKNFDVSFAESRVKCNISFIKFLNHTLVSF